MELNYALAEFSNKNIIQLNIQATNPISSSLVSDLNKTLDAAEDAGPGSIVLINIKGEKLEDNSQALQRPIEIHLVSRWEKTLRRLERLKSTTISIIEDSCGILALEILLATDYRIITKSLSICLSNSLCESWPGMLIYRLANQIGIAQSRKIVLFGKKLSAENVIQLKLVDEITDDVFRSLVNFLRSLDTVNLNNISVRRQLLLEASAVSFENALGMHLAACDRILRYSD